MPSIRLPLRGKERWEALVVGSDGLATFLGRALYPLALLVLLGTGFFLRFAGSPNHWEVYSAVRVLHLLSGLAVTVVMAYRLAGFLAGNWRSLPAAGVHWRRFPVPRLCLEVAFWAAMAVLVFSGAAQFAAGWLGFAQPRWRPPFGWSLLHGIAAVYFVAFLLLRWFVRGKTAVAGLRQYLYKP